jgi:hypothetical protein
VNRINDFMHSPIILKEVEDDGKVNQGNRNS